MSETIGIELELSPTGYLTGVDQATQANERLRTSMGGLVATSSLAQRALEQATPKRITLAAFGGMAALAASNEQALSQLNATQTVTGVSAARLGNSVRSLARDMPLGTRGARDIVLQFNQMGVASRGSEARIDSLAKTVGRLGGATGEGPAALAQGMTQLSRATGNQNLDPARFGKLADSLTTVSAQSGASATSILSFAKNIAPLAQSAGIGATGVLGISSAFARLGEDGIGASTAVNKMLTDMSRAVREGGPQLRAYAEITGMTVTNFEALAKNDPSEALTRVTESIARAGRSGPRMLEMIGIEGVRGQRAIQGLVSSGGLRQAVAGATEAYGSGSTQRASEAAYSGLNDSLTELQASVEHAGEAFGRPLLGPLTAFTNALKLPVNALRAGAESRVGQIGLTALAGGAATAMLLRAVFTPAVTALLARQMLTSGPLRAMAAGRAAGSGRDTGFLARFGAPMSERAAAGTLGAGMLGGANTRLYELSRGYAQEREARIAQRLGSQGYLQRRALLEARAAGTAPGGGLISRTLGSARGWATMGLSTYAGMMAQQARNSEIRDPGARPTSWGFNPATTRAFEIARAGFDVRAARNDTLLRNLGSATADFNRHLRDGSSGMRAFNQVVGGNVRMLGAVARGGLSMAGGGIMAAGRAGAGALASTLGPTAAIMGLFAGGSMVSRNLEENREIAAARAGADVYGTLNAYRESINKATEAAAPLSSALESLGESVAKTTDNFEEARRVAPRDIAIAESSKDRVTRRYAGTAHDVAGQITSIAGQGLAPDELQAIKVDLLRQFNPQFVGQVIRSLPADRGGLIGADRPTGPAELDALIAGTSQAGMRGGIGGFFARQVAELEDFANRGGMSRARGGLRMQAFNEAGQANITSAQEAINQRYQTQSGLYGTAYAEQERLRGIEEVMSEAAATGNKALVAELGRAFSGVGGLTNREGGYNVSLEEIRDQGFVQTIAGLDETFRKRLDEASAQAPGFNFGRDRGRGLKPTEQRGYYADILAEEGSPRIAAMFDQTARTPVAQAVGASLNAPENWPAFSKAVDAMTEAALSSGKPLEDLAIEAAKASNNLSDASAAFALVRTAQQRIQLEVRREGLSQAPGVAQVRELALTRRQIAEITPSTQEAVNEINQLREQEVSQEQGLIERIQARLQAERQAMIATDRARADHRQQMEYAEADHQRSITYMTEDAARQRMIAQRNYDLQVERNTEDHHRNVARAEEDFNRGRARQLRDFNISMARGEEDYQRSRARAVRDFTLSMRRQVEDAAAGLYDPFERIQTKATWDGRNLLVNLGEQTAALTRQRSQLDQVRQLGLSGDVIDQLGLGKTENAQQLNQLVGDLMNDPALVKQFNDTAAARLSLAAAFTSDDANKEGRRAREDFDRQLRDMEEDYRRSTGRSRDDLSRGMRDQMEDFRRQLSRGGEDFRRTLSRAETDFNTSLADMATNLAIALARAAEAQAVARTRAAEQLALSLRRMREDIKEADVAIVGDLGALQEQLLRVLNGQQVQWKKVTTDGTQAFLTEMRTKLVPGVQAEARKIGVDLSIVNPSGGSPGGLRGGTAGYSGSASGMRTGGGSFGSPRGFAASRAEGGIIPGHSPHPKADNVPVLATAGEFMQPVAAVQYYGERFMEALRTRSIPKGALELAEGGLVAFGNKVRQLGYRVAEHPLFGGVAPVHARGSEHYNRSGPGGGNAVDVNWAAGTSVAEQRKLAELLPLARQHNLRTIFMVAGHYGHAHFDGSGKPDLLGAGLPRPEDQGDPPVPLTPTQRAQRSSYGSLMRPFTALDAARGGMYGGLRDTLSDAFASQVILSGALDAAAMPGGGPTPGRSAAGQGGLGPAARAARDFVRAHFGFTGTIGGYANRNIAGTNTPSKHAQGKAIDVMTYADMAMGQRIADYFSSPTGRVRFGVDNVIWNRGITNASRGWRWGRYTGVSPHTDHPHVDFYDAGGYLRPGVSLTRNDTGKPEPVLTEEQWATLTQQNTSLREVAAKMSVLLSAEQGASARTAAAPVMVVHHNETITYDQRNDFGSATISVTSADPDDMARQLAERGRAQRLTQTRGVRRS